MGSSPFGGLGNALFTIVPVLIIIVFIFVFSIIIVRLIKSAKQWKRNNGSPILTVDATVVAKRTYVHQHNTGTDNMQYVSSSTTYYATFQVSSGDRMEFEIREIEYGMLVKNDKGRLTFQGTRYLGFERDKS